MAQADSPEPERPTEIVPLVFLGNLRDARNLHELRRARIAHIVNVAQEAGLAFADGEFEYTAFQWQDFEGEDVSADLDRVAAVVHRCVESQRCVLVHCVMGRSRSVAAVAAYLIKHRGTREIIYKNTIQGTCSPSRG